MRAIFIPKYNRRVALRPAKQLVPHGYPLIKTDQRSREKKIKKQSNGRETERPEMGTPTTLMQRSVLAKRKIVGLKVVYTKRSSCER